MVDRTGLRLARVVAVFSIGCAPLAPSPLEPDITSDDRDDDDVTDEETPTPGETTPV